jgi:hypothetical protein
MHILRGILIFKGLIAQRHYMSFGVKGLSHFTFEIAGALIPIPPKFTHAG